MAAHAWQITHSPPAAVSALLAQVVALDQADVLADRDKVAKAEVHAQADAVAQAVQEHVQVITAKVADHAQVKARVDSVRIVAPRVDRSVRVADVVQAQR